MSEDLIKRKIINSYLAAKGDEIVLELKGQSMHPILLDGWKIKLQQSDGKDIERGDLIVFFDKGLVCHRVNGKFRFLKKLYFLESGDAQSEAKILEEKSLLGKAVEVFNADGMTVEKNKWRNAFIYSHKFFLLAYIHFILFLAKRFFLGKRQNGLIRKLRTFYCKLYSLYYNKLKVIILK